MPDRINIGLIGAGRIGTVHAQNLSARIARSRVAAIADIDEEPARRLAAATGAPQVLSDYQKLLANPDIAAVLICSSTDTHARIIEEAAQAGKHIFCEKPIAHSLEEIDRALAAVARAGVQLQIGFNRRFDANYRRVRHAVESREIGEPYLLHITSRDPDPPPIEYIRTSGGMLLDMTIHDFDMARFLIGDEVEEVYAQTATRIDPAIAAAGDVDTAVVLLRFSKGVIGTIDNCRRAAFGYDQRVEILGSKGAVHTLNNYPNQAIFGDGSGIRRDLPLRFFMERYTESFVAELSEFVDCVAEDRPVPVGGADGRAPVVLALAAARSAREGRPVQLKDIR